MGIVEYWVYFSCDSFQWEAFDPNRGRWIYLPRIICDVSFMFSYKESLAIGIELLIFGKDESRAHTIYTYSNLIYSLKWY
jgi:hypothetical protein